MMTTILQRTQDSRLGFRCYKNLVTLCHFVYTIPVINFAGKKRLQLFLVISVNKFFIKKYFSYNIHKIIDLKKSDGTLKNIDFFVL